MGIYISDAAINTQFDNDGGSNPVYIGKAFSQPGVDTTTLESLAFWSIKMLTYDGNGNITSISYANAGANNLIWDSRAEYAYS